LLRRAGYDRPVAGRYWVKRLDEIRRVADDDPRAPGWHPLQHDEVASGQEELYVVVTGEATFDLDEEPASAPAVTVVAVPDPTVRRRAVAAAAGTVVLAVGGKPLENFVSSWRPQWFEHVPRASGA
jgi:hypothetical protein